MITAYALAYFLWGYVFIVVIFRAFTHLDSIKEVCDDEIYEQMPNECKTMYVLFWPIAIIIMLSIFLLVIFRKIGKYL
jgi:hypothetical protein